MRPTIPVTIISGFLGSGKTTVLNHILSESHGVRAAVLVNDFGAINIDAKLVVGVEGETVSLANGCICCNIRTDLIDACKNILARTELPEAIIVETSGVSDPLEVVHTFDDPALQNVLTIGGILAVVDAEQFPVLQTGEVRNLARNQIHASDIVILNKTDLVDTNQLKKTRDLILEVSPTARLYQTVNGRVPSSLVFDFGDQFASAADKMGSQTGNPAHSHIYEQFDTFHWSSNRQMSLTCLKKLAETLPDEIYRAKGIVHLEELPGYRVSFQMVGKRYNFQEIDLWGQDTPNTDIVVIGSTGVFDKACLNDQFEACVGTGNAEQSPLLKLSRRLGLAAE
ncbi:CobW family GTP-binding protein [Ruegeria atlantica]|uniref:CobW family GTP-binding protein n=1 Tax=Ruegeria atlantica TaxID=81569 RepID=UPI00148136BA|nr:GTP-binding protein [Ruegeria atlantica]